MDGAPVLLRLASGIEGVQLAPLEVPVVGGGRLDLFGETGSDGAVHVELQAANDGDMHVRMLGYLWLSLRLRPQAKVRQIVLYVGREPPAMPTLIEGPGIAYHYDLVDARDLRAEALLASEHPCDIIMAFFSATDDLKARVRTVVQRLAARLAHDPTKLKDALVRLLLLSPLRRAEPIVHEEISAMPITIDLETHPFASKFFLKGRAEGKAEGKAEGEADGLTRGKAEMLLRLLQRRFQTLPNSVEVLVQAAENDQLDTWSERFVDAQSLTDVFGDDLPH